MPIMKTNYQWIEVDEKKVTTFTSALEKQLYLVTHKEGTYRLIANGNAVEEDKYIIIDTEGNGFVLNKTGLSYYECIDLIEHYE